jgi:hypothetical protein
MLQADRGRIIDYIKDNIDSCLAFANFEFDSIARNGIDGTILLVPRIKVTMNIDFESLIDYANKKRLEELDDD